MYKTAPKFPSRTKTCGNAGKNSFLFLEDGNSRFRTYKVALLFYHTFPLTNFNFSENALTPPKPVQIPAVQDNLKIGFTHSTDHIDTWQCDKDLIHFQIRFSFYSKKCIFFAISRDLPSKQRA